MPSPAHQQGRSQKETLPALKSDVAKCELVFLISERKEVVTVTCEYDAELFHSATINRFLGHYQTLLAGMVANSDQRISVLSILTEPEKQQLLVQWNETGKHYPVNKCIHQLFEEQVERTPDALAVVSEDQELTYRKLNQRANQVAHYLIRLGVGPEIVVGILTERSLEMVVAVLGVLKAGGTFVPLDPSYPKERLAFIVEDTQTRVLLTQRKLVQELIEDRSKIGDSDPRFSILDSRIESDRPGQRL